MTALIIICAIVALICLILSVFIRISIVYENDGKDSFVMKLHILFFSFSIIPESKRKKVNPKDFTYKKYQKLKDKELKKQNKAMRSKKGKKASSDKDDDTSKKPVSDVSGMLKALREDIGNILDILKQFTSHLHVDIQRFIITLGGDNAAKTALTYGIAYPAVLGIFELLESFCIFSDRRKSKISVDTDFTSKTITADIKIQFKIRVLYLLGALIRFLLSYMKNIQKSQGE